MWWLWMILSIFLLLIFWLLLSTIQLSVDTRIQTAEIRWRTIGSACLWWDHHWKLRFQILFYSRTVDGEQAWTKLRDSNSHKQTVSAKKPGKHAPSKGKILAVLKTFQVDVFNLTVDTGNYVTNARLFPLNYMPGLRGHMWVNFEEQNYLVLNVRNRPLRMLMAFLRN